MQISRRDALLGATAAAVVTGSITVPVAIKAAGVQAALGGDPVIGLDDNDLLALLQKWLNLRDYINNFDGSDEEIDALYNRLTEREEAIFCCPARTPAGITVKLQVWDHYYNSFGESWPYRGPRIPVIEPWWRGDLAVMSINQMGFAQIMRDLERLAGKARS